MSQPQTGIFALGTASHAYLEFDARNGVGEALVRAVAGLREPRTTMGGVTSSLTLGRSSGARLADRDVYL